MVLRFYTKKTQVIPTKREGVTAIFPNFDFILNRENQRHTFIFARNDLKLFVYNLRTIGRSDQLIDYANQNLDYLLIFN